jgi:hypothetical protein
MSTQIQASRCSSALSHMSTLKPGCIGCTGEKIGQRKTRRDRNSKHWGKCLGQGIPGGFQYYIITFHNIE